MVVSITKVNNTGCIDSSIKSKKIHFLDDSGEGAGSEDASEPHKEDDESLSGFLIRSLTAFHEKSHLTYRTIPNVSLQDIKRKEKLGEGGFAIVYAAEYNGNSCAFKSLQPDVVSGAADKLKIAAADLCKEAELLSALNHPNIVSILAKGTDVNNVKNNFIIIERLEDTLEHRMKVWREQDQKSKGNLKERLRLLHDRLRICLDVCHSLQHLHEMNVLYRDLKAENLGFDKNGKIKLFDFGLAKELKDEAKATGEKYSLSGNTGSLTYMAPEVAKGWHYDKMVDVYSFGILLWEIAALQHAFPKCITREDMHPVWSGDKRPPMADWWPVELQWLMKKCWSYFAKSRPDFTIIIETLKEILDDNTKEEEEARAIKSFRFGSRRSQKISLGSQSSEEDRRITLRPRDLPEETQRKKFFGLF